ncbi:uncharacterized protein [Cherax quadricarinatus]|uniref:uncharacterized protein isoform X2 n=1 Tax=Cherax quadricarinatus TaxID=27406 RepID=UPI0023791609|nr:uncharacterized protein LOC128687961 [Cherax quadricarinatus]
MHKAEERQVEMKKTAVTAADVEGQALKFSSANSDKKPHKVPDKSPVNYYQHAVGGYVPVSTNYPFPVSAYGLAPSHYPTPYGMWRSPYYNSLPPLIASGPYFSMPPPPPFAHSQVSGPRTSTAALTIPPYFVPSLLAPPPGFQPKLPRVPTLRSSAFGLPNLSQPLVKTSAHQKKLSNISSSASSFPLDSLNNSPQNSTSEGPARNSSPQNSTSEGLARNSSPQDSASEGPARNSSPQNSTSEGPAKNWTVGLAKPSASAQKGLQEMSMNKESDNLINENFEGEMLIKGFVNGYISSETECILETSSILNITIPGNVVYINGIKANPRTILKDTLPIGTPMKAIIKLDEPDMGNQGDKTLKKYTAVVAWFGDIPSLKMFFPSLTQFSEKQDWECRREHMHSLKTCSIRKEACLDGTEISDHQECRFSHIIGYIWWGDKDRGILRIYEDNGWGSKFSGITFSLSALRFEGQRINCKLLYLLLAHVNKCEAWARRIETKVVFGMEVKWEAVYVECGHLPHSPEKLFFDTFRSNASYGLDSEPLTVDSDSESESDSDSDSDSNSDNDENQYIRKGKQNVNQCIKVKPAGHKLDANKLSNDEYSREMKETNKGIVYMTNGKECDKMEDKKAAKDSSKGNKKYLSGLPKDLKIRGKGYAGKHLTGCIMELFSADGGSGVAKWMSMEFGDIFIKFKQDEMYFQLVPLSKMAHIPSSIYTKRCNLYVLPVESEDYKGYRVQLLATCGWIGNKPVGIPATGTQEDACILITHLNIDNKAVVNSNQNHTDTKSTTTFEKNNSSINNNNLSIISGKEFKNFVTVKNNLDDIRVSVSSHSTIDFTLKNKKKKNKTRMSSEDSSVNVNTSSISSIYSISSSVNGTSSGVPASTQCCMIGLSDDQELLTGEVMEVHSNMGKLKDENGTQHYFSRDHCYLYGISLRQVELWHVLMHGQQVQFRLTKTSTNRVKVTEVVIGVHGLEDRQNISSYVYQWCKNNAVPDSAQNMLMKQLEDLEQ